MPGFGFGAARRASQRPSGPTAMIPANYDVIFFGDSRSEDGIGSAANQATGYSTGSTNFGHAGWLPVLSGDRLRFGRYPNFGIASSNTTQGAAIPRLDAVGAASTGRWDRPSASSNYASNKGADYARDHAAGIVVLLYGTNDGGSILTATENNLVSIMNTIGPGKLIVLVNELPRGIDFTGAVLNAASNPADRYTLSRELLKYDFASGHAKARANVIAVNGYDEFLDASSGANYYPKRGYLRDGLHFTAYGAMRLGRVIVDRLAAVLPGWAALPRQIALPTAAAQPFVHSNPLLTPGANGQVVGTFAAAPAASGVPEGWVLWGQTNAGGFTCTSEKGVETDPDGFPAWKVAIGGTVSANASATVTLYQSLGGTPLANAIAAGNFSLADKLRGVGRIKVDAGSVLLTGVGLSVYAQEPTATRQQTANALGGTTGATAGLTLNAYLDAAEGSWWTLQTELIDLQDPNLVAAGTNVQTLTSLWVRWSLIFRNLTASAAAASATVRVSRTGVLRVA